MKIAQMNRTTLDIAFCYPLFDKVYYTEPVGILALSSFLKENGFTTYVDDGFLKGFSCEETLHSILRKHPTIIGVSITCAREVEDANKFSKAVKSAGFTGLMIAGGDFAGFHKDELLDTGLYHAIILGEDELALLEFMSAVFTHENIDKIKGVATLRVYSKTIFFQ